MDSPPSSYRWESFCVVCEMHIAIHMPFPFRPAYLLSALLSLCSSLCTKPEGRGSHRNDRQRGILAPRHTLLANAARVGAGGLASASMTFRSHFGDSRSWSEMSGCSERKRADERRRSKRWRQMTVKLIGKAAAMLYPGEHG